jgi:hypothetical protein
VQHPAAGSTAANAREARARTNSEGGRLASARLSLGDRIAHQDERFDRSLLDRRRLLKAIRVDAAEEVLLEAHVVKALDHCTMSTARAAIASDCIRLHQIASKVHRHRIEALGHTFIVVRLDGHAVLRHDSLLRIIESVCEPVASGARQWCH